MFKVEILVLHKYRGGKDVFVDLQKRDFEKCLETQSKKFW